jgi:trehalose/maltose transport system permease protein
VHPLRVFFRITLPLIRPALMVAVVFRALDALRVFDLIYVLTSGNAAPCQHVDLCAPRAGRLRQDVGYGSAAATSLFLIIAL